jgi:predicted GIY-YIG superfamily endonuclease
MAYLYILRCSDGSYYVGTTRGDLEMRIAQHQAATFDSYTARRRPVQLVFSQEFMRIEDAIAAERQVKGWRREKKEALIRGDCTALPGLSRRAAQPSRRASRRAPGAAGAARQHEEISAMASSEAPPPEEAATRPSRDGILRGSSS